jgi:GntR family transcriptional regulator
LKDVPLYVQVERRIEDLLLQGRYKAGDRIPPETELATALGVSRVTVRAGLARLVERGLLERRRGSGTFLVRPPGEPGCGPGSRGSRRTPFTPSGWA